MTKTTIARHVWELATTGAYADASQLEVAVSSQYGWRELREFFEGESNRKELNELFERISSR